GREQDREPEVSERNHAQPPSVRRRMQGFRRARLRLPGAAVKRAQWYIFWRGRCSYEVRCRSAFRIACGLVPTPIPLNDKLKKRKRHDVAKVASVCAIDPAVGQARSGG